MIDLNNTWCEATEENYNALLSLGLEKQKGGFVYPKNGKLRILKNTIIEYDFDSNIETTQKLKQIHLVNGKFQYVESKPKNNFKDYGFEAGFEGEILKTLNNGDDKIEVLIGYIICNNQIIATTWDISGYCYFSNEFSLNPIKKEWYENPDNFPTLVVDNNKKILYVNKYQYTKRSNTHWVIYEEMGEDTYRLNLEYHRPATKEEVLTLLVKE